MTTLFFRNTRLLALTLAVILVGGVSAFLAMPREEDPRITNRWATVITPYPGADAERVEQLVTEKIEDELREIAEIKEIRSHSRNAISVVTLELEDWVADPEGPFSQIRDALSDAEAAFPAGVPSPRFDEERGYAYTLLAALAWDSESPANLVILKRLAKELQNRLRNTPGTELVTLFGAPEEEILVTVEPAVIASLGLDAGKIADAIATADSKVAAGQLRGRRNEVVLEVRGELDSLSRLREVPLLQGADGTVVRVGDIARIDRGIAGPPDELALVERKPAVVVAVRMETHRRVDAWAETVRGEIDAFARDLSDGVKLDIVFDQSRYTSERFSGLVRNLLLGAGLVVAVLLVTLGWRAALLVTAAIPLTALLALTVLNILGIPIHQMSVTGLIVALGLLVDAAIVMVDAVQRRLLQGLGPLEAISQSVRRLWIPLLSSTLTTVLGFMPITLLPGGVGEFVGPIAISVITALIGSFLLAVTVIPALAGRLLAKAGTGARAPSLRFWHSGLRVAGLTRLFARSLELSLRWPRCSLLAASVVPLLGFVGMTTLTSQFFPEADRDQFHIELRLPPQASIYETRATVERAHDLIMAHEEVAAASWFIGQSAPKFYYNLLMNQDGLPNYAQAAVTASSIGAVKELIRRLQPELDAAFPEAQIVVRQILQGPPTFAPVELRITGNDLQALKEVGEAARLVFSQIPEIVSTRASIAGGEPKLWLEADEDQARQSGLGLVDIARELDGKLEGVLGGSIVEASEELPVRVRITDRERASLADIASLTVLTRAADEGLVDFSGIPLQALGRLVLAPAADTISRFQGERVNVISGYVEAGALPATAVAKFQALWAERGTPLPPGIRFEFGGDDKARSDAVANLLSSVGLITVLMLATIVLTFNSFRLTSVVLIAALQAMGLGLFSLTLFDFPFGFQPIIGLLGLVGVAINAAIIILSALRADPAAVAGDLDAIRRGVLESSRHITSTTITTFGGFLPLILSEGGFWPPFATAIAGGVLLSTLVSFYFVPPAFLLLTRRRPVSRVEDRAPADAPASLGILNQR